MAPHPTTQRYRCGSSAPDFSARTTIGAATGATDAVTGTVDLVSERVDVQDVQAEAAAPNTAVTPDTTIAMLDAAQARGEDEDDDEQPWQYVLCYRRQSKIIGRHGYVVLAVLRDSELLATLLDS